MSLLKNMWLAKNAERAMTNQNSAWQDILKYFSPMAKKDKFLKQESTFRREKRKGISGCLYAVLIVTIWVIIKLLKDRRITNCDCDSQAA